MKNSGVICHSLPGRNWQGVELTSGSLASEHSLPASSLLNELPLELASTGRRALGVGLGDKAKAEHFEHGLLRCLLERPQNVTDAGLRELQVPETPQH